MQISIGYYCPHYIHFTLQGGFKDIRWNPLDPPLLILYTASQMPCFAISVLR